MSRKGKGLLALITGIVAGAAAVFLSTEENRAKAVETVKKAKTSAKKAIKTAKKKTAPKKIIKK